MEELDENLYPGDDDHVVAVFFQSWNNDTDWLSTIWIRDGKAMAAYRFRYYEDDKNFDSEDRKSWYALSSDKEGGAEEILKAMKLVAEASRLHNAPLTIDDLIMVNGTKEKMLELMAEKPWCHIKRMSPDGIALDD